MKAVIDETYTDDKQQEATKGETTKGVFFSFCGSLPILDSCGTLVKPESRY